MIFILYQIITSIVSSIICIYHLVTLYLVFSSLPFELSSGYFLITKITIIFLSLYVIVINEVARRNKRWEFCVNLFKYKKQNNIQRIDLFILFSFSLVITYIVTLLFSLLLILLIRLNPTFLENLNIWMLHMTITVIKYATLLLCLIPLYKAFIAYKKQKNDK